MSLKIEEIATLLEMRGQSQYGGEAVSQLEHALQCAALAEQAGETAESVIAALLHDLGHLLSAAQRGVADDTQAADDLHQYIAVPFLRGLLPPAVIEPIRLHVEAKRYLCQAETGYWEALSPASRHSLVLQGGAYTAVQAATFLALPFAEQAVRLRRYDDRAKTPGLATPALARYLDMATAVSERFVRSR